MQDVLQVNLTGRLVKEIDYHTTANGRQMGFLTIASNYSYKDGKGAWQNKARFNTVQVIGDVLVHRLQEEGLEKGQVVSILNAVVEEYSSKEEGQPKKTVISLWGNAAAIMAGPKSRKSQGKPYTQNPDIKRENVEVKMEDDNNDDVDDSIPF